MTDTELNFAVAEVAGIFAKIEPLTGPYRFCYRTHVGLAGQESHRFDPANDWNDAMEAAEKVGLFDPSRGAAVLQQVGTAQGVLWDIEFFRVGFCKTMVCTKSGPHAICEAILVMKGSE